MALEFKVNTYVTLEEADAYFDTRLGSDTWTATSDADKEKALIMAARTMNEFRYIGRKLTYDQKLAFPRISINAELNDAQLILYTTLAEIPDGVKYAQCEQAIYLLEGEDQNRELMQAGVQSYSAGGASFSLYNDGYASLAPKARRSLSPYLTRGGRII